MHVFYESLIYLSWKFAKQSKLLKACYERLGLGEIKNANIEFAVRLFPSVGLLINTIFHVYEGEYKTCYWMYIDTRNKIQIFIIYIKLKFLLT